MLLPLPDRPVIVRCLETITAAGIDETVVVLAPPYGTAIHEVIAHFPVTVAWNCQPESDMAASLRVGLDHLTSAVTGVLVFLPDTPLVSPATCRMLIDAHSTDPQGIIIPIHGGRRGHPLLLPRTIIAELSNYPTLRDLLHLRQELITLCSTDDKAILLDMDTPEEYEQLLRQ